MENTMKMNGTRAPRVRLVGAAALVVILSWAWIPPPQACAQLLPLPLPPLPLPPLPRGLVVTITDPASDSKVSRPITRRARWSPAGTPAAGLQFNLDGVNLGAEAL